MSIQTDSTGKNAPSAGQATLDGVERGNLLHGILATLGLIAAIEILSQTAFHIPNAGPVTLLAVVYATYTGGTRTGLVSAALALIYMAWNFSNPGEPFHFSPFNFNRLMVLLMIAPLMAIMVGALRRRSRLYEKTAAANTALQAEVAERKALEQKHRELLQYQRALLDGIAERAWLKDAEGRYLAVNRNFADLAGLSPDQMIGKTAADILPPDAVHRYEIEDREAMRSGKVFRTERPSHIDGGSTWREIIKVPVRGDDGCVVGLAVTTRDISDRKKIETALQESEQSHRAFFESAAVGMGQSDPYTGRLLRVNDKMCLMTGYSRDELMSMTFTDITHPEDRAADYAAYHSMVRGELPYYQRDKRYLRKDGTVIWVSVTASLIRDPAGRPLRSAGVIVDITERKQAEAALRQSEEKYRALMDTAGDGIVLADLQGNLLDANPQAVALLGYGKDELTHMHASQIHPPEEVARVNAAFSILEKEGRSFYSDGYVLTKDRRSIPVDITATTFEWQGRRIAQGIFRDITARKQADAALKESEERFRRIAENIREIFWIGDRYFRKMLYVSPAFEEIWGMPLFSIYRNPLAWKDRVHPDDLAVVAAALDQQSKGKGFDAEFRIIRSDGRMRWIRSRSFPYTSQGEEFVTGIAEDVTELKHAEEERLAHALKQRDTLVREVHHRIKNNLQAVAGLLMREVYQHPELGSMLKTAIAQVQLIAVVHGIQADATHDGILLCEITPAIARIVESLTDSRIAINVMVDMPRAAQIRERESVPIALILNELLVNAVKHTPGDVQVREVDVTISRENDMIQVKILNRGSLPPGSNFASGIGNGTGLGLVRSLMPRQGAELSLRSVSDGVEAILRLSAPVIEHSTRSPSIIRTG